MSETAELKTWQYGSLKVFYTPALDGGGIMFSKQFIRFFKYHSYYHHFPKLLEWCSGPGFLGFAMLAEEICDELVLIDVNPAVEPCIQATIRENRLEGQVRYYISDNFKQVPPTEKFDLVVGIPPRYVNINPQHPRGPEFMNDLRARDEDWHIHEEFYKEVGRRLNPGAHIFLSEMEPYKQAIYIPQQERIPFDIREEIPMDLFKEMMDEGGIQFVDAQPYSTLVPGLRAWIVCSRLKPSLWQRLMYHVNVYRP